MSPVINDQLDRDVIRRLDDYAESLRAEAPSAALDARMEAAITEWAGEHRKQGLLRRPMAWVVAAASIAVVAAGIALLVIEERPGSAQVADATANNVGASSGWASDVAASERSSDLRASDLSASERATYQARSAAPELSARTAVSPLATGSQVSLFPAEGAVFRVKANLAAAMMPTSAGQPANGERQYWVDVRIANDGTMRIMQVLPAERGRVVPRE